MNDRTFTPEVYGDFYSLLPMEQMGLRPKHIENTKTTPQSKVYPKAETSDWYKRGEECPF